MATCERCGAEIRLVETMRDGPMAVDRDPVDGGRLALILGRQRDGAQGLVAVPSSLSPMLGDFGCAAYNAHECAGGEGE